MKLQLDTNVVAEGFATLSRTAASTPPPLAANWPLIGTKLNCRRPLTPFLCH